jgi:hypothetical protein
MKPARRRLSPQRIRIGARHWTAVATKVFEDVLPMIRRHHAATVFLALYHRAWHMKRKKIRASLKNVSDWTGLDYRTVRECLKYLEWKRFIICRSPGTLRSSSDVPVWEIPATKFNMKKEGWVPVPSFIFTDYLLAHSACQLLPLLLYYQNMRKLNECFPSVSTLRRMLGCWSERMVYDALKLLIGDWDLLGTGLPVPVEIARRSKVGLRNRYYSVRAVYYDYETMGDLPVLFLTKEFSKVFNISGKSGSLAAYDVP